MTLKLEIKRNKKNNNPTSLIPKKVYEFEFKDDFDKEFGFIAEYGIDTIEHYNKTKAFHLSSQSDQRYISPNS